jgi:hypothetical protein
MKTQLMVLVLTLVSLIAVGIAQPQDYLAPNVLSPVQPAAADGVTMFLDQFIGFYLSLNAISNSADANTATCLRAQKLEYDQNTRTWNTATTPAYESWEEMGGCPCTGNEQSLISIDPTKALATIKHSNGQVDYIELSTGNGLLYGWTTPNSYAPYSLYAMRFNKADLDLTLPRGMEPIEKPKEANVEYGGIAQSDSELAMFTTRPVIPRPLEEDMSIGGLAAESSEVRPPRPPPNPIPSVEKNIEY